MILEIIPRNSRKPHTESDAKLSSILSKIPKISLFGNPSTVVDLYEARGDWKIKITQ